MRFLFSIVAIISFGLTFAHKQIEVIDLASAVIARSEGELTA